MRIIQIGDRKIALREVSIHFALMDRVLCFPGRLVQVERLWVEKWENQPS